MQTRQRIPALVGFLVLLPASIVSADDLPIRVAAPSELLAKIEDDRPLRSKADNPAEAGAWELFIRTARTLPLNETAKMADPRMSLRRLDEEDRGQFRGKLFRVTGQLQMLREMTASQPDAPLYEARVFDALSYDRPIHVVMTELPAGVTVGEKIENVWVVGEAFFFKRLQTGNGFDNLAPLAVARTLRVYDPNSDISDNPLFAPGAKLNCPSFWIDKIEDDRAIQSAADNLYEYNAYNFFVQRSRNVDPTVMASQARPELSFARLFETGRGKYRGEIVVVEGKLRKLEWIDSDKALKAAKIPDLYEAWIFPSNASNNPICVVFSELPAGTNLKTDWKEVDAEAVMEGYFFKRYRYKAQDGDRLAPLVIGRSIRIRYNAVPSDDSSTVESYSAYFVPILVVAGLVMFGTAVFVARWFRKEDEYVHNRLEEARARDVFRPESPE